MLRSSRRARWNPRATLVRYVTVLCSPGAAVACGGEDSEPAGEYTGPLMRPGEDCLSCHSDGAGRGAPTWSLGGTVYPRADAAADEGVAGVDVVISDAEGGVLVKLTTNAVGNFYTAAPLPSEYRITLEYQGDSIAMPCPPPAGLCNACHNDPPIGQAPGRIYIPQGEPPWRPPFDCERF